MTDPGVIYGINAVVARLQRSAEGITRVMIREGKLSHRLQEVEALARKKRIAVIRVDQSTLDAINPKSNQGVALETSGTSQPAASLDEIIGNASGQLLFLVLDGVTDPRNLGACVRSAATMGVDAVIVPKDNSAGMTEVAVKTASGGASQVPVIAVTNLSRTLDELRRENVWVVGTLLDAEQTLAEIDLTGHIAIVLGSEGRGLRQNTIKHCDFQARIPMATDEFGFNVSVAAGICLYEAYRQRKA